MKYVVTIVVALVLAASGAMGLVRQPDSDPPARAVAPDAGAVSGRSSGDLGTITASLQERLREVPRDDRAWATLALAYVEQGRVTGDASWYPKAQQAARRSLSLDSDDNALGHSVSAALAAARHDFGGALRQVRTALSIDSYDDTGLAVRVDALTELGRYPAASVAARVADSRRPSIATATRYAYQLELRGELEESASVLRRAVSNATHGERAEVLTLLADLDRREGRLDASGREVRQALRERPGHLPALVALARLHVALGDLDAAATTWATVVRRLPTGEHLTELGELELVRGRPAAARQQFSVVDASVRLLQEGGVDTDLETALFETDHGDASQALASARAEWGRRQSIHVADAYAWALHRQGRDAQALRLARSATRLGTQEARLWLHRGRIEAALGLSRAARSSLERGLAADPGVSPWQAEQARAALRSLR